MHWLVVLAIAKTFAGGLTFVTNINGEACAAGTANVMRIGAVSPRVFRIVVRLKFMITLALLNLNKVLL